ncbi:MAG: MBL fold metallo-hydrolase [Chloroflexi bacterium]|nr:MBL fold metallo-hydrolase [Chloroflexota bacterium]
MKIRLLGAHNCESASTRLPGIVIDNVLVLDAGSVTSGLSLREQETIEAIFLTHHHYDHIRDMPALAMNRFIIGKSLDVYAMRAVREALAPLFDGALYPNFFERPPENPTLRFVALEPGHVVEISGYRILPVPVTHAVPSVGFQVTAQDGKSLFYTGDTGPGLSDCWRQISPRLLLIEVTIADTYEKPAGEAAHMTPALLRDELMSFRALKGYLPRVVVVHMNPTIEKEIIDQLVGVARELECSITPGREGMELEI